MDDRDLVMLKSTRKVPTLAKCVRCEMKFFTPFDLTGSPIAAKDYLVKKFQDHGCKIRHFPSWPEKTAVNQ